jgi:hypothetical protein
MTINIKRANELVHIHASAFQDFFALINAKGGYRPSLDISVAGIAELADIYDAYQAGRGDDRVAFRFGVEGCRESKQEPLADRIRSAKAKAKKEQRKGQRVPYQVATNLTVGGFDPSGELLDKEWLNTLTKRDIKAFIAHHGDNPNGPWKNTYFVEGEIEGADSPYQFMSRHDNGGWDDAGWINAREYWDVELSPADL